MYIVITSKESCASGDARNIFDRVEIKKVHNLLICQRSYGPNAVSEKTEWV